jgi:hypothetical protein
MRPDKAKRPVQDREKSPLCRAAAGLQSLPDQVKVRQHNYKSASRSAFSSFVPRRLTTREGVLAKDGDSPVFPRRMQLIRPGSGATMPVIQTITGKHRE